MKKKKKGERVTMRNDLIRFLLALAVALSSRNKVETRPRLLLLLTNALFRRLFSPFVTRPPPPPRVPRVAIFNSVELGD